jgi:hypothetical protein
MRVLLRPSMLLQHLVIAELSELSKLESFGLFAHLLVNHQRGAAPRSKAGVRVLIVGFRFHGCYL